MTLRLEDRWVWDFWFVEDGEFVHVFFLQAPRSLGDPELRHRHARLGHAVSRDLRHWDVLPDPMPGGPRGAFDDVATWTGSIIRGRDAWYLLYTGLSSRDDGRVQRIGLAVSTDLITFHRTGDEAILSADPRWYETDGSGPQGAVAWRDPYVFADPSGSGYHAVITARSASGPPATRGVIGHAVSADLRDWEVLPPLISPAGFAEMEVPQVVPLHGSAVLVFSVGDTQVSPGRRASAGEPIPTGTYVCRASGPLGPFDVPETTALLPVTRLYAGKLIRRAGEWLLLGFVDRVDGSFVGELSDPIPFDLDAAVMTTTLAALSAGRDSPAS
jgi:beta-fructofuranosidase